MTKSIKKLINFRPAVVSAVYIIWGIITSFLFLNENFLFIPLLTIFVLLSFVLLFFFIKGRKRRFAIYTIVFIILYLISFTSFYFEVNNYKNANVGDHYFTVSASIKEISSTDYGSQAILTDADLTGVYNGQSKYNIELFIYGDNNFEIGDKIRFSATLIDRDIFYEGSFSATNVQEKIKYYATINREDIDYISTDRTLFQQVNTLIKDNLSSCLSGDSFTISYALLTGNSDYMAENTLTSFRSAGVAHIFVVSGMHIGFVASILAFIFNKLKCNKIISLIITSIVLIFYAGVCGFSASSIRATIMCVIGLIASITRLRYDGLSSIGLACSLILLFAPVELFCVGFQLSFVVVLSIILLSKPIAKIFKFLPDKVALLLGSVLSAFLASFPICLNAFNSFSVFAIIANLLFIPLIGVIFSALILAVFVGAIFSIADYILIPFQYIFGVMASVINAIDYSTFIITGISICGFSATYYLALIISSNVVNIKKTEARFLICILFVISILGSVFCTLNKYNSLSIYACGDQNICATIISNKGENILVVNKADSEYSFNRLRRLSERNNIRDLNCVIFTANILDNFSINTKLLSIFSYSRLYIYGEQDEDFAEMIKRIYNIDCYFLFDDDRITSSEYNFKYKLEGYAILVEYNSVNIGLFSTNTVGDFNYSGINENVDYSISIGDCENIKNIYNPKQCISYLICNGYKDCEREGNYTFSL